MHAICVQTGMHVLCIYLVSEGYCIFIVTLPFLFASELLIFPSFYPQRQEDTA